MSTATAKQLTLTPQEYLLGEQVSEIRHEYIDGEVYAMAGGSDAHARISLNIAVLLKNKLRGSGCSIYFGEMKAQVGDSKYFYPDVMVTCHPDDLKSNYTKQHPKLIIEVLSASTEGYDRGKKFEYYRQLPSLEEYVLIEQSEYHVDIFRKNVQQRWELFSFSGQSTQVYLAGWDFWVAMSELYEDVNFTLA